MSLVPRTGGSVGEQASELDRHELRSRPGSRPGSFARGLLHL